MAEQFPKNRVESGPARRHRPGGAVSLPFPPVPRPFPWQAVAVALKDWRDNARPAAVVSARYGAVSVASRCRSRLRQPHAAQLTYGETTTPSIRTTSKSLPRIALIAASRSSLQRASGAPLR
jgi:hypothetical protein